MSLLKKSVAHRFYHFLFLFHLFISVRCTSNRPIQVQFSCFKSWLELHETWSVVLVVEVLVYGRESRTATSTFTQLLNPEKHGHDHDDVELHVLGCRLTY